MTLEQYHKWVYEKTNKDFDARYHALIGLTSEIGEVADAIKREDIYGQAPDAKDGGIFEEAGDILFYLSMLCEAEGFTLQEALDHNVEKLNKRYKKGFTQEEAKARADKMECDFQDWEG